MPGKQVIQVNAQKVDNVVNLADILRNLGQKSQTSGPLETNDQLRSAHETVANLAPQLAAALEALHPAGGAGNQARPPATPPKPGNPAGRS